MVLMIPNGPSGFPTLSASQFRTYGTGGLMLADQEEPQGCPRKYHSKYVLKEKYENEFSYPLRYGGMFHQLMFLMEEKGLTPDEALEQAFDPELPQEMWTEAREDIHRYMERGASPADRYATLAVELELEAILYVDEEFGPIYFRGFLDWLGVDPEYPSVIHSVDYKTNRAPVAQSSLRGDVQLRGYDWLIRMNAEKFVQVSNPRVVTHLDVVKFNDVEIAYSPEDIDDWHSWAVAMARKILRDEEHRPILNKMCSTCPIRNACPAYEGMPMEAAALTGALEGLKDPVARLAWRDRANKMRLNLEKSVKAVDMEFKALGEANGKYEVGDEEFVMVPDYQNTVDIARLRELLGDDFLKVVTVAKGKVEALIKPWEPSDAAPVKMCFGRELNGSTVVRQKKGK